MKNKKTALRGRRESFRYAFNGFCQLFRNEPNAWIHAVAGALVLIAGCYFDIEKSEWLAVILCIGIVLTTEIINTAIENICDHISPDYHERIKIIKDLAAAAVLVSAVISAIIAAFVFIPRLIALF